MAKDITRLSAVDLARLIRTRKVSPVEAAQAHLAAIERINPAVNAFCTVVPEKTLAWAREAEAAVKKRGKLGPLHGVPVAIKDLTVTAGIRTTFGSTLYRDHVPTEDAEVVRRLKAAGAIVLGKTNTPEFGAGANTFNKVFGATRNPWNTVLSASGSTGGGAAALAARMAPLAEGTDFGGSLRTPAAFCGVVGLRTTAGLVTRYPVTLPWHDQSVTGPMARSAEDCALLLDAMVGFTLKSPLSAPAPWKSAREAVAKARSLRGLRLAYAPDIAGIGVDRDVERLCRAAAQDLRDARATVDEIEISMGDGRDAFLALRGEAMVGNHMDKLERIGELGDNLAGNIRAGLALTVTDIARAERKRAEIWHRWRALFEIYDLVLTPATPVPPFPVEKNYPDVVEGRKLQNYMDWIGPTFLVSLAALPAVSVPAGLTPAKLPVGLQIIGPRFSEPTILSAAKFVEEANPIGLPPNC
ncbi:MAG TPA: amidase [Burkholderiales bacterium]|nr:amidase [Burkholderiales bacterium]